MSKVINLKAIHNQSYIGVDSEAVVSNVSKVINLKAIHNFGRPFKFFAVVVSNVSKVINLKAIHNEILRKYYNFMLFPMCQR